MVQSNVLYGLETIRWLPRLNKIIDHHENRCFRKLFKVPSTYIDRSWTNEKVRQSLKDKLVDRKRAQLLHKFQKINLKISHLKDLPDPSTEQQVKLARQRAKAKDTSEKLLNIRYELPSITEIVKRGA